MPNLDAGEKGGGRGCAAPRSPDAGALLTPHPLHPSRGPHIYRLLVDGLVLDVEGFCEVLPQEVRRTALECPSEFTEAAHS